MAHNPAPKHPTHVDIGTAIAINRQGPVKPGTNTPLKPMKRQGPYRKPMK